MLSPERLRRIPRRNRVAVARGVFTRTVVAALSVVALAAGVAACSSGGDGQADAPASPQLSLPPPSVEDIPVVTLPDGFVQPDTRGVRLSPVVAQPKGGSTPPLPVTGGAASLGGVVEGPDGPVGGATVRIERWVGGRSGSITLTAGADGRFGASNLLGGRFRVRAWLQPNLAARQSEVVFLANDGSGRVTVELDRFEGQQLQANLDLTAINVDDTAHIRALFTRATVDDDGIVVGAPVPGARIQLTSPAGLSISGDNPATTNDGGLATFTVKCDREGAYTVSLTTEGASTSYTLPTCGPKPAPPTTTPDIPPFAVGDEFTVPRAAPLPPGTYTTFVKGCSTTFQAFTNGAWETQRREIKGDLQFVVPVRDLRPSDGTDGCSFLRTA
jgi:hypothetical protein